MISYIIRFLFLLLIFYLLKKVFSSLFSSVKGTSPRVHPDSSRGSGVIKRDQVEKDPVCGMFVAREAAVTIQRNNETIYFCSEKCREKFLEAPKP